MKESDTAETCTSQSSGGKDDKRTETAHSSVVEIQRIVNNAHTMPSLSIPAAASQTESQSHDSLSVRGQKSGEKATEEIRTSSAGQVQSTADSELHTLGSSLTRGNSAAAATSGKGTTRIKKKVAPKVVSSRPKPKRTPSTNVIDGNTAPKPSQTSSQQQEVASTVAGTEKTSERRDEAQQDAPQRGGFQSSLHRTQMDSEGDSCSRTTSSNASTNQTSDEAISNTLNEVLCNTHSHEPEDVGLAGIVPARLGLLGGLTPGDDLHSNDTILITSQHNDHTEVEVRTESADVRNRTESNLGRNTEMSERTTCMASSVQAESLNSEESFVVQTCTDATRTMQSPQPTSKTSQTSQSSSPSSSQEPSSSSNSRRSGSAGPRSRRSQSRTSSIGSEAGEEGGKDSSSPGQSGSKGRKRAKVKWTVHLVHVCSSIPMYIMLCCFAFS